MAVHASHAALPYPIKGARYSMLVPLLDADGDPTAQTTPDTEISKDNAAATDAAEEVSATSGMDGMGLITFTGAETDCTTLAVNFKASSGPKATLAMLYPRVLATVGTGTLSAGSAGGGTLGTLIPYDVTGCFIKTTGGTGGGGTGGADNQVRKIVTYDTGTGAFTVAPNWETTPSTDTTYAVLLPEGVTLGMLQTLNPTTAGRKLDVTATGAAGIDWGNVENPTATVNLSGTSTSTVDTVINGVTLGDVAHGGPSTSITAPLGIFGDITGSLSGNVGGVTGLVSLAPNAITSAKIQDGAFTASKFAASSLNGKGDWATAANVTAAAGAVTLANGAHGGSSASLTLGAGVETGDWSIGTFTASGPIAASGITANGAAVATEANQTTILNRLVGTIAAGTHVAQSGDAYAIVNSGTHGNAALKTLIDAVDDYVDAEVSAIKGVTDKLDTALELDGAVYRLTANALEQAPSGGLDAAGVRAAIGMAQADLDEQLDALVPGSPTNVSVEITDIRS